MAKRMFDTTTMSPNNPGLTYVTPQGLPAKFSNLGAVAKLSKEAIGAGVEFDEKQVTNEAEEIASASANDYLSQSPSELLFQQQELRGELQLDPNNEQASVWKTELAEVTNKLNNVYTQGGMSSYEFERRANAKVQDLINRNPAYRDEIVSETSKTYNALGLTDVLTQDKAIMKAQADALDDENKAYNKIILEDGGMPFSMNMTTKRAEVARIQASLSLENELKDLSERESILDINQKVLFENNVGNFTFRNSSGAVFKGYDAIAEKTFNDVSVSMKQVINNSQFSNQEKLYKAQQVLRSASRNINYIGRQYTPTNKDMVTTWTSEQSNQLGILTTLINEDINGDALKKHLDNLESNASVVNKLDLRLSGYNPEAVKAGLDMKALITRHNVLDPTYKPTQEALDQMSNVIDTISAAGGAKLSPNPNNKGLTSFYVQSAPTKLVAMGPGLDNIRKNNLEMEGFAKGFVNNLFTASEALGEQQGPSERIKYDDRLFGAILQQSSENTNYLLETLPEFRESMLQEVDYYKDRVHDTIVSISNDEKNIQVNYLEGLGIFNVPNNPKVNMEIARVNKYIQIKAKIQGVNPNKVAKELLTKDFPMFTLGDKPVSRKISKEEADRNPDSVTEFDVVVMPDGTEIKGPQYAE